MDGALGDDVHQLYILTDMRFGDSLELRQGRSFTLVLRSFGKILADNSHAVARQYRHHMQCAAGAATNIARRRQGFFPGLGFVQIERQ